MGLGSWIRNPRSGIRKKPILDPGSRGQKSTGSRIRIRNTAFWGVPLVSSCEELSVLLISSLEGFPCFAHQFLPGIYFLFHQVFTKFILHLAAVFISSVHSPERGGSLSSLLAAPTYNTNTARSMACEIHNVDFTYTHSLCHP